MKKLLPALSLVLGTSVLVLAGGCGGGGGGGGSLRIVSCSLGCSGSGAGGDGQVSCGIQDVYVNGELSIAFNSPVDEDSLTVFTLQVTQIGTGKTPSADRFVSPNDPTVVIYRPKLSFDSSGVPVFGFTGGASYTLKLPGQVEDAGSTYVRSIHGTPNRHRMLCTVEASLGVLDLKPGAPSVTAFVDTVTAYDPVTEQPSEFAFDVPASGALNVWRFSPITMTFNDVMNPATLVNPVSGKSDSVKVVVDPDGVTSDPTDQQELLGTFSILIDQDKLQTHVTFTSVLGYPSAGSDPLNQRKIVVKFSPSISDLGGNPLSNGEDIVFTPEFVPFTEIVLTEEFDSTLGADLLATGGDWGQTVPGFALPGIAGGSGRLGHLFLSAGQTLVLNTDMEDFSSITDDNIFSPANVIGATFDGTSYTFPPVTDGVFEFASLRLNSGSLLRFEGSQPARVFVRGQTSIQGTLSAAGADVLIHDDVDPFGQVAGSPGPGGGAGGTGGRQPTWIGFQSIPGVTIPPPPATPPVLAEIDGQAGGNVPDNLLAPTGTYGGGEGGLAWPQATATFPLFHLPVNPADIAGVEFDLFFVCNTLMKGGSGGGGGFGLNGGLADNKPIPGGLPTTQPPAALGGLASSFGVGIGSDPNSPPRLLSPEAGYLHGGGGGGGGGGHLANTATNGKPFVDCTTTTSGTGAQIIAYLQHSGAAGGGGGGGLQLQVGSTATIDGVVDASGGKGGDKKSTGSTTSGGGGAGGGLLLQAKSALIAGTPGRLDVSGGPSGFGVGGSLGGRGGAGLLRLEVKPPLLTLSVEAPKFAPNAFDLALVGATLPDVYSLGQLPTQVTGPGALSGVQSCWIRPEGNFFVLTFVEDDVDDIGWDMTVIPKPPSIGPQSFRGDNLLFTSTLEDLLGNELGVSPLVVRFQGARAIKETDNPCNVKLAGEESAIVPGSLTGWVTHPSELNTYFTEPGFRPNMIRFQILFDRSNPFMSAISGISELHLRVVPD
jgi:hypothetical protein